MSESTITTESLKNTIAAIHKNIDVIGAELNELDGKLGDGDLGVTLINGFNNMQSTADTLPADVGMALFECAKAVTKVSGSSFGTLMATSMIAAGKLIKGQESIKVTEVPKLLQAALDAMMSRGGASLGDKTVLDSISAMIVSMDKAQTNDAMLDTGIQAANEALAEFNGKINKIGRARIFGERTIGMDDPGMVAIVRMLNCLKNA
ncbi:dihydroxyacetone kinase subunit L [Pseudocolwellia agarivorans]|uniref:dihydroxyacetone kinase subunit L n=1 Tax=Pseudocolwellia agarivorans TaxID=1911682 RepID=UPI0009846942|nr:dihydroxyacetone kinase subunit L [Pseudocolwellia agarivorans]